MLIALDYDDTITKDPEMWIRVAQVFQDCGHEVVIATMRTPEEALRMSPIILLSGIPVVPTSRKAKKPYLESLGLFVDVWIDDRPDFILLDALPPEPPIEYEDRLPRPM